MPTLQPVLSLSKDGLRRVGILTQQITGCPTLVSLFATEPALSVVEGVGILTSLHLVTSAGSGLPKTGVILSEATFQTERRACPERAQRVERDLVRHQPRFIPVGF